MIGGDWHRWLQENLERGCNPDELTKILRTNGFAPAAIQQSIALIVGDADAGATASAAPAQVDSRWQHWIQENLERGCSPHELRQILTKNGFSDCSIALMLPGQTHIPAAVMQPDYEALADPPMLQDPPPALREYAPELLQLFTLDDFLSAAECDEIAALTLRQLRPSTVTTEGDYGYRTSSTSDLSELDEPAVAALDLKIARTLGIRPEYSEAIQAQRYEVGQEFKRHTDYFEPGTDEYARFAAERGNRTWTFMVYLNEGMKGGSTRFFAAGETFKPRKGQAVIWNNLYRDGRPNPDTLHAGEPVTAGYKLIITKWFLETGSGPMFFGDE